MSDISTVVVQLQTAIATAQSVSTAATVVTQLQTALATAQGIVVLPTGMPTSCDFLPKAFRTNSHDRTYAAVKRDPNTGDALAWGGFGAINTGFNGFEKYSPVANAWRVTFPDQVFTIGALLPDGSYDVRGKTMKGNVDNQGMLISKRLNEAWIFYGQRQYPMTGNYAGRHDLVEVAGLTRWKTIEDDVGWSGAASSNLFSAVENWNYYSSPEDGPCLFDDERDIGITFAAWSNPHDSCLTVIRPNVAGAAKPYIAEIYHNTDNFLVPGFVCLRNCSIQCFVRGHEFYIYAGYDGYNGVVSRDLYKINVDVPGQPVMSKVVGMTNNLPDGQRVDGDRIIADWDPVKDQIIATNGKLVNVGDFATQTWVNVPVNTPPDENRNSPNAAGGNRAGFFSPEIGQLLIFGAGPYTFSLKLNF